MYLRKLVGLVLIDLKKPFDTAVHIILCKKLELMVFYKMDCPGLKLFETGVVGLRGLIQRSWI